MEQNYSILIIDRQPKDGATMQRLLENLAGGTGRVALAKSWREGMIKDGGRKWDLVLVDVTLVSQGQVNGWKEVSRQAGYAPVIVFGDALDAGLMLEALDAGVDSCIFRPEVTSPALLGTVHAAMDRHRSVRPISPLMMALAY